MSSFVMFAFKASVTKQAKFSPYMGSGIPKVTASAISLWVVNIASISSGEILTPPLIMTIF